jgi:hypothetical protein
MSNEKVLDMILKSLDRAHDKLDCLEQVRSEITIQRSESANIAAEQQKMNDILDKNTQSLELHIRRTEILEQSVTELNQRVIPIEKDYLHKKALESFFATIGKWVGILGAGIGTVGAAAWKFFSN